jgi:hypothetical protein
MLNQDQPDFAVIPGAQVHFLLAGAPRVKRARSIRPRFIYEYRL